MRLGDFRTLVHGFAEEIPPEFRAGVVALEVSPKAVPDPLRRDVYTLGECIPLEWSGDGANLQSRVVLYYGSFLAVAGSHDAFDWRREAWDTLSHELRHHLEWRANVGALEAYDWAVEQNFARHAGEVFDAVFYRSGERLGQGVYKVDDDVFIEAGEAAGARVVGEGAEFVWHGRRYSVPAPSGARSSVFLSIQGLEPEPAGEVMLVLPKAVSLWALLRRREARVETRAVAARALNG
jgi:hypothetical protein